MVEPMNKKNKPPKSQFLLDAQEAEMEELRRYLKEAGISQHELSDLLKKEYGHSISVAEINKRLNAQEGHEFKASEMRLIREHINKLIKANNVESTQPLDQLILNTRGKYSLITDPKDPKFIGYPGTYHIYFPSTVDTDADDKIISGTLIFEESDFCKVTLVLSTGVSNNKKTYQGNLVLLDRAPICYCLLFGKDSGEICLIVFNYVTINHESLKYSLAVAATISAGGENWPTVHRMLISHRELKQFVKSSEGKLTLSDEWQYMRSQLLLNGSKFYISKTTLDYLRELDPQFTWAYDMIEGKADKNFIKKDEFYELDESTIKLYSKSLYEQNQCLALLRLNSLTPKNNKLSGKLNRQIFAFLDKAKDQFANKIEG